MFCASFIAKRSLGVISLTLLVLGLCGSANAAIYTFSDAQLLAMTAQINDGLSSQPTLVKANSAAPVGFYGDGTAMEYRVGFQRHMELSIFPTPGTIYIGITGSFLAGVGDFLTADFSNDNDDRWRVGVWVENAVGTVFTAGTLDPILDGSANPPPENSTATLDISLLDIRKAGIFVTYVPVDHPNGFDTFHISVQGTPDNGEIPFIPEPGTMVIWSLGAGLIGAVGFFRRRRKRVVI